MLVRLRVLDAQGRLLLVRRGRSGYGSPRTTWRSTGPRPQPLHVAVREYLKGKFLDWHSRIVNFDEIKAAHVVRHGDVVEVTLTGRILEFLPDMVACDHSVVLAWPQEVEAGMVIVSHRVYDILEAPISPTIPTADAA